MSNQLIKASSLKDLVQQDEVKSRLKEIMGERAPQFAAALVQIVKQSFQLQKCEPSSVIGAALTAAALDMSIDPNIGEAHIVPFGDKATFQLGFKGFIQLAMRSGEYKSFGSTVVYDGELITYDELTGELVVDKSKRVAGGKIIGYAAKFKLLNGFERGEFWTAEEIENHAMMYSKQYRFCKGKPDKEANCLWITKRDEMAIKTVEKSLLNHYGPKSVQMRKALKMDSGVVINADTEEVAYVDNTPTASAPEFTEVEVVPENPKTIIPNKREQKITPTDEAPAYNKFKAIRGLMKNDKLEESAVISFLIEVAGVDESAKKLEDIQQDTIDMLESSWADIANRIKGGGQ